MENENIIVPTNIAYSSCILRNNIEQLKKKYNFIETGNIGYSVLGKPLPYIKLGKGTKEVMYGGSFHANEWITSVILMKFIEDFAKAYNENEFIYGYRAKEIFDNTSIYIVPMVNPDGVDLVTGVIPTNTGVYNQFKDISLNFPNISFPNGWKANFNGVDFKNYQPFAKFLVISDLQNLKLLYYLSSNFPHCIHLPVMVAHEEHILGIAVLGYSYFLLQS